MALPTIRYDLSLHGNYGNLIAFTGAILALVVITPLLLFDVALPLWASLLIQPWLWALVLLVAFAVGKEKLWDARGHGTEDMKDARATILGGLPCVILATLIDVSVIANMLRG